MMLEVLVSLLKNRGQITALINAERDFIFEVVTGVVCQLKVDMLKEIDVAVGELRGEMNVNRAVDQDKIVELPNFLTRKAS